MSTLENQEIYWRKKLKASQEEVERLNSELDNVYSKNKLLTKDLCDSVDKRMRCIEWLEDREGLETTYDILYEGECFVMIDSVIEKLTNKQASEIKGDK